MTLLWLLKLQKVRRTLILYHAVFPSKITVLLGILFSWNMNILCCATFKAGSQTKFFRQFHSACHCMVAFPLKSCILYRIIMQNGILPFWPFASRLSTWARSAALLWSRNRKQDLCKNWPWLFALIFHMIQIVVIKLLQITDLFCIIYSLCEFNPVFWCLVKVRVKSWFF